MEVGKSYKAKFVDDQYKFVFVPNNKASEEILESFSAFIGTVPGNVTPFHLDKFEKWKMDKTHNLALIMTCKSEIVKAIGLVSKKKKEKNWWILRDIVTPLPVMEQPFIAWMIDQLYKFACNNNAKVHFPEIFIKMAKESMDHTKKLANGWDKAETFLSDPAPEKKNDKQVKKI
jgi:hypothetical protein